MSCRALRAEPDPEAWRLAADEWQRLGHRFPAAYARWREAELLLAARRAQAAQAPLRTAFGVANSLGAEPLKAQAKALAACARLDLEGAETPTSQTERALAGVHGLTRRELQVLGLLADGRTNREIARALFVSEKTAGTHVSSILGKLEARAVSRPRRSPTASG